MTANNRQRNFAKELESKRKQRDGSHDNNTQPNSEKASRTANFRLRDSHSPDTIRETQAYENQSQPLPNLESESKMDSVDKINNLENKDFYNEDAAKQQRDSLANDSIKKSQKAKKFFGRNKGKITGGLVGLIVTGGLMMGGILLSGPMQLIHTAEFLGSIANTMTDTLQASRLTRNVLRSMTKTMTTNAQNRRVSTASRYFARSLEKSLAQDGVTIATTDTIAGRYGYFEVDTTTGKRFDYSRLVAEYGDEIIDTTDPNKIKIRAPDGANGSTTSKFFRAVTNELSSQMTSGKWFFKYDKVRAFAARTLGVMNLVVGFHPIQKLTAKVAESTAGKAVKSADELLGQYIEKRSKQVAKRTSTTKVGKALSKISSRIGEKVAKGLLKGITTALKGTVVLAVVGFAADVLIGYILRQIFAVPYQANLNIAAGKTMEIMSTADQMKTADWPEQGEDEVSPLEEIGLFTSANLSRTIYTDDGSGSANSANISCPTDNNGDIDYAKCTSDANNLLSSSDLANTETSSTFWQGALVREQMGYSYNVYDGSVPIELFNNEITDAEMLANSIIEAAIFISPDMFEEETGYLDADSARPDEIGSISVVGAVETERQQMASMGGHVLDEEQADEFLNMKDEILAEQYNQKSWFAKLFDYTDYQSGIATLARDAGWDTSSQDIGTQFANVIKTIAMVPNLIAGTVNRVSYAAADGEGNASDVYDGAPTVGFTYDQFGDLPEYDVAEDWVLNHLDLITTDKTKDLLRTYAGVEIKSDGSVKYLEDTDGENNKALKDDTDERYVQDNSGCSDADVGESYYGRCADAMIRAYLFDYKTMNAAAISTYDDDIDGMEDMTDAEKNALYTSLSKVAKDMGIGSSSSSDSSSSGLIGDSPFSSAEAAVEAFWAETNNGTYGSYSVGVNGCTTMAAWFVGEHTDLIYGHGNGGQVASQLVAANPDANPPIEVSTTPSAPAVFSTMSYNSGGGYGGYGHTGVVIAIEGNYAITAECGLTNQTCWVGKIDLTEYAGKVEYVYLGDHIK